MLDSLYWLAAVLGLAGALTGNRVAWPLLASFGFYQVACWQQWPFDRDVWAMVDCVVLIGIAIVLFNEARKDRLWTPSGSDLAVVFLFVPLMTSYALEQAAGHILSMVASIAQLLVVVRYGWLFRRWKANFRNRREWTDLDLRVAA